VRGAGLARGKESTLGTWQGGWPRFNRRGDRTRNLLGGWLLADFLLSLPPEPEPEAA